MRLFPAIGGMLVLALTVIGPAANAQELNISRVFLDVRSGEGKFGDLFFETLKTSGGWVVVYNAEGEIIGYRLFSGDREYLGRDTLIELATAVEPGDTVTMMLHEDTGKEGWFEFRQGSDLDRPITLKGEPLMVKKEVDATL